MNRESESPVDLDELAFLRKVYAIPVVHLRKAVMMSPKGIVCPKCGHGHDFNPQGKVIRVPEGLSNGGYQPHINRGVYVCASCGIEFHITLDETPLWVDIGLHTDNGEHGIYFWESRGNIEVLGSAFKLFDAKHIKRHWSDCSHITPADKKQAIREINAGLDYFREFWKGLDSVDTALARSCWDAAHGDGTFDVFMATGKTYLRNFVK